MKRSQGFTVIEIIAVIIFLSLAVFLLVSQQGTINAAQRDSTRKTALNAMYYNLEEVFYAKNGYYPYKIDSTVLTAMDPALFTDPNGIKMNQPGSSYTYVSTNCTDNKCKSYTLKAQLEKEADYVKTSRND